MDDDGFRKLKALADKTTRLVALLDDEDKLTQLKAAESILRDFHKLDDECIWRRLKRLETLVAEDPDPESVTEIKESVDLLKALMLMRHKED